MMNRRVLFPQRAADGASAGKQSSIFFFFSSRQEMAAGQQIKMTRRSRKLRPLLHNEVRGHGGPAGHWTPHGWQTADGAATNTFINTFFKAFQLNLLKRLRVLRVAVSALTFNSVNVRRTHSSRSSLNLTKTLTESWETKQADPHSHLTSQAFWYPWQPAGEPMSSELRTKTTRTFNEFVQLVKQLRGSCERATDRERAAAGEERPDRFLPNKDHKLW